MDTAKEIFDWVEECSKPENATAWTCGLAAEALFWMFTLKRFSPSLIAGSVISLGHVWVEMDGLYYDPTIKQFGDYPGVGQLPHPLSEGVIDGR